MLPCHLIGVVSARSANPSSLSVYSPQGAFHRQSHLLVLRILFVSITQNVQHMRPTAGRLPFSTPGVRPFPLLTPERPSSSTFTFVGFSRAEEVLLCMAPPSCSAVSDRTSAIRMSLALLLHSCDQVPSWTGGTARPVPHIGRFQRSGGVSPVFSRQAVVLVLQAPGSQRPCVASRKHLSLQVSCDNC